MSADHPGYVQREEFEAFKAHLEAHIVEVRTALNRSQRTSQLEQEIGEVRCVAAAALADEQLHLNPQLQILHLLSVGNYMLCIVPVVLFVSVIAGMHSA